MTWRRCAQCGSRAAERARFCDQCGTALTPGATALRAPSSLEAKIVAQRIGLEGERKQVTVMFTDIVDSMALTRALEPERWGVVLDRFLAIAADSVHAFEGTVSRFTGDGLMAIFGAPLAHEDHARRACLAVLELQRGVAALAADLARSEGAQFAVRCGLNSGEVVIGSIGDDVHMDFVPLGNTVALARRIESLAPVASTAVSATTAALVQGEFELRELGEFEVKGVEERQKVLELVGPGEARSRLAAVAATRGLSRFVGRAGELAELESALAAGGGAIGIVGDPGVGKSRLVHEFVSRCAARGVTVHATAAVAHGRDAPLLAALALFRSILGTGESDAPAVFDLLGAGDPELDFETRRRRAVQALARELATRSPEGAVLVVEDLQWLDDASAAYLEALAEAVAGAPLLLICTCRSEHPAAWMHDRIDLAPLDAQATDELLAELLGRDGSIAGLPALIEARAAGNPFFLEEIIHALADNGQLVGGRGRYRLAAELDSVALPPTVQAGLAARIDRLPERERTLLHIMSVIGGEIPIPLLQEVCDLDGMALADAVAALARSQLVISSGGDCAFKHPLTREVAYGSQLSDRRARTHHAVAAAIERAYPDGLDERSAILAHHCDAAGDAAGAAHWHARAATWTALAAPGEAMRHWHRVRDLASELDPGAPADALANEARVGLLGLAWRLGMSPDDSAAIHAEGDSRAEALGLDLNYAATLMHNGRERDGLALFRDVSRRAVATGDAALAITPACGLAFAAWIAGSLREALDAVDQALDMAGGEPTTGAGIAFACPYAHAYVHRALALGFMGNLDAAREASDDAVELARVHGDPEVESYCHANLALLEAITGRSEASLDLCARSLEIAERAGNAVAIIAASTPRAVAEADAGRFAAGLAGAEAILATVRRDRVGVYYEPVLLATIARCRLGLGEPGAALVAAEEAVAVMDARGLTACALHAPIVRARVLVATDGPADRVDAVLSRAAAVARAHDAGVYEPLIDRARAAGPAPVS